jgi:hypothetical protein
MARLPKRPHHTVDQKRHDLKCLTERISELESWDPFVEPDGPNVAKLQDAINETLAAVFGHGTTEYEQYKSAAQLEQHEIVNPDIPRWKFSLGGVYAPEIQARETARQNAAQSKQQSLRLLQQAVGRLKQELEHQTGDNHSPGLSPHAQKPAKEPLPSIPSLSEKPPEVFTL